MSFTSFPFAAFLVLSVLVYYAIPSRWKELWILAVSLAFYCSWSYPYVLLLCLSVIVFWQAALRIESASRDDQKFRFLRNAVLFQILILFSFKLINGSSHWGRFSILIPSWAKWIMPLGLSYYTFKLIGYIVEVYFKKIPAEKKRGFPGKLR